MWINRTPGYNSYGYIPIRKCATRTFMKTCKSATEPFSEFVKDPLEDIGIMRQYNILIKEKIIEPVDIVFSVIRNPYYRFLSYYYNNPDNLSRRYHISEWFDLVSDKVMGGSLDMDNHIDAHIYPYHHQLTNKENEIEDIILIKLEDLTNRSWETFTKKNNIHTEKLSHENKANYNHKQYEEKLYSKVIDLYKDDFLLWESI